MQDLLDPTLRALDTLHARRSTRCEGMGLVSVEDIAEAAYVEQATAPSTHVRQLEEAVTRFYERHESQAMATLQQPPCSMR